MLGIMLPIFASTKVRRRRSMSSKSKKIKVLSDEQYSLEGIEVVTQYSLQFLVF